MDIDLEDSPLYKAVVQGIIDDVRSSLTNKVFSWDLTDHDEDDYIFRQALGKAIEIDRQDIVRAMFQAQFGDLEYGVGNWKHQYVTEALETAARLGKQEIVEQLLETEKDSIRRISNALAHGAWSRNLRILQMLIDAGASANCETTWGTPLIAAARTGDLKVVQFLVEAGADINMWVDMDGYTSPLLVSAYDGHEEVFEYLLPLVTNEEEIEAARNALPRKAARRKQREQME